MYSLCYIYSNSNLFYNDMSYFFFIKMTNHMVKVNLIVNIPFVFYLTILKTLSNKKRTPILSKKLSDIGPFHTKSLLY